MNDLVVLVADKNMEFGIRGVLSRGHSLGFVLGSFDIYVHPERDPGCLLKAHDFLRSFHRNYEHAVVLFDREGCGQESLTSPELETNVDRQLSRSGWDDRAATIVLDPELENWVWSDSPHVESVLGWQGRSPGIRDWLLGRGVWKAGKQKPDRPKEAMEEALRAVRRPRSSSLYFRLAEIVDLDRCSDSAFLKLRKTLGTWFPPQ